MANGTGDYGPDDLKPGMRCMAPMKKPSGKRELVDVEVVWVSVDRRVVDVRPVGARGQPFAVARSGLRKPGTKTPLLGLLI